MWVFCHQCSSSNTFFVKIIAGVCVLKDILFHIIKQLFKGNFAITFLENVGLPAVKIPHTVTYTSLKKIKASLKLAEMTLLCN